MEMGIVPPFKNCLGDWGSKLAYLSIYVRTHVENITHNANFAQAFNSNTFLLYLLIYCAIYFSLCRDNEKYYHL